MTGLSSYCIWIGFCIYYQQEFHNCIVFYIFISIHLSVCLQLEKLSWDLVHQQTAHYSKGTGYVIGLCPVCSSCCFISALKEGRRKKRALEQEVPSISKHTYTPTQPYTHTQPGASGSRTHWTSALLYKLLSSFYLFNSREQVIQQRWEALRFNHFIDLFHPLSFLYLIPTAVCSLVSSTLLTWLLS